MSESTANEIVADGLEPPPRKRRRAALSCADCKRRKVKCDRGYPACSRCQKGGHPETCFYETPPSDLGLGESVVDGILDPSTSRAYASRVHPDSNSRQFDSNSVLFSTLHAQADRIRQLENRVIGLESVMARYPLGPAISHGSDQMPRPAQSALTPENISSASTLNPESEFREPVDLDVMYFRGKNFKTQFYGSTHPSSLLSQVCVLNRESRNSLIALMITVSGDIGGHERELHSVSISGSGESGAPTNEEA